MVTLQSYIFYFLLRMQKKFITRSIIQILYRFLVNAWFHTSYTTNNERAYRDQYKKASATHYVESVTTITPNKNLHIRYLIR